MISAEKALDFVRSVYTKELEEIEQEILRTARKGYTRCSYSKTNSNFEQLSAIADVLKEYGYDTTVATSGQTTSLSITWHGAAKKGKGDSDAPDVGNRDSAVDDGLDDDGFDEDF